MRIKNILLIFGMVLILSSVVIALELRTAYNPFTSKLDYYRGSNFSGENITADWFFGLFNWTALDGWNSFDGAILEYNETKFNETIDSKLLGDHWFFVNESLVYGTADGNLNDTHQYNNYDGVSYNLTETTPQGLEYYINTSDNVTSDLNKICARFLSSSTDDFTLSIWDTGGFWESYMTLSNGDSFSWVCADIRDAPDHLVDDKVLVKIFSSGIASLQHKLYIDAIYVSSGYTPIIGNEVDPLSFHVDSNINNSGYNITADYFIGDGSQLTGIVSGLWTNVSDVATYDGSINVTGNATISDVDFNGGWLDGGLSIIEGDIFAQTGYFFNITSLNVTEQNLTITDDLNLFGNLIFSFGEMIDNLVDGVLRITGSLNVTENLTIGDTLSFDADSKIRHNSSLDKIEFTHDGDVWKTLSVDTDYVLDEDGWVDTGSNLIGNLASSQTAVIDGYVYLFGGFDGGSYTDVIYRAPTSNVTNWSDTGYTLPADLGYSQTAIIGDYVYLFGGYNGSNFVDVIYHAPTSNATNWSDTGFTLPGVLGYSQVAVIGDYVYLFGGYNGSNTNIIYRASISNVTNWSDTSSTLPDNLALSQVAVIGDYVYLFGGYDGNYIDVIYRATTSDPTTWSDTGSTLPSDLALSQTAIIGDYVYLFGGYNGSTTNIIYRAPTSDPTNWLNTGSNLPGSLSHSQTAVIGDDVYLFGGNSNVIYSAPIYTNAPKNIPMKSWTNKIFSLPLWRNIFGVATYEGNVEVGGNVSADYYFGDGSQLTGVGGVPQYTISAFNLASCPTGWTLADGTSGTPDLRGIFVRGAGTSGSYTASNGTAYTATFGEFQNDSMQGHWHEMYFLQDILNPPGGNDYYGSRVSDTTEVSSVNDDIQDPISDGTNGEPRISYETAPASFALIYCMKVTPSTTADDNLFQKIGNIISLANSTDTFNVVTNISINSTTLFVNTTSLFWNNGSIDFDLAGAGGDTVTVIDKYETGWISRSDWTNVHLGTDVSKNVDSNITHNLDAPLSELNVKIFISTDGTDANSIEISNVDFSQASASHIKYGARISQVDSDNIQVQTAIHGFVSLSDAGDFAVIDNEDWYYKIVVLKPHTGTITLTNLDLENLPVIETYNTGWISRSDWTNVHMGTDNTKNADSDVIHNLDATLSELDVRVFFSSDGTDANSFEIIDHQAFVNGATNNYGITTFQVDSNNLTIQTGIYGISYTKNDGNIDYITTDDWYYKIVVKKFSSGTTSALITRTGTTLSAGTAGDVTDIPRKSYDTGWISRSDWTNVHLGTDDTKNADSNVTHNLDSPLSDVLVKVLVSTDGTDEGAFETISESYSANDVWGITLYAIDDNNIKVQTGSRGFLHIGDAGSILGVDTEDWYYKIKVFKLG